MPVRTTGIIYLERDKFQLYTPVLNNVLEFRFIPEIISDLDVVNQELLVNVVKLFLANSKLPPSDYLVVIADNAAFIKDILAPSKAPEAAQQPGMLQQPVLQKSPKEEHEQLEEEAKQFVENTPFDTVVSKNLPLPNGLRVFAVNQELFDALKNAFGQAGSAITAIIPGIVYGNNLSAQPALTPANAGFFLQRYPFVRQYNLLHQEAFIPESKLNQNEPEAEEEKKPVDPKKTKKETIVLSGVLGLLVIVLVVVYMMTNTTPTNSVQSQASAPPAAAPVTDNSAAAPPVATQPPAAQQNTSPAIAETSPLAVQVINASDSAVPAQQLQVALTKYGFKSVALVNQQPVLSKAIVTFMPTVSQNVRTAVIDEVQKITGDVQVQGTTTAAFDVTITVGK